MSVKRKEASVAKPAPRRPARPQSGSVDIKAFHEQVAKQYPVITAHLGR